LASGLLQEGTGLLIGLEERFNTLAQWDVVSTRLGQPSGAFRRIRFFQRFGEEFSSPLVKLKAHE